jgi:ubiquinone/menaquinone biosynthesis C-methylase UbiE
MLVAVAALFSLVVAGILVVGYPRVVLPRKASFEGIEDSEFAEAYDRMSRTPQLGIIRRMFVSELKKHNPAGSLVDVWCGLGYLVAALATEMPGLRIIGVDIS